MCERSRHKFRLSQCHRKHALMGLVVRIPRDKVVVFPDESIPFIPKAWVLELPGVYLLIGVDWVGFQSLISNIHGFNMAPVSEQILSPRRFCPPGHNLLAEIVPHGRNPLSPFRRNCPPPPPPPPPPPFPRSKGDRYSNTYSLSCTL